jgi:hypothetical protein
MCLLIYGSVGAGFLGLWLERLYWRQVDMGYKQQRLTLWAQKMSRIYKSSVYLGGSALHSADPRDWDLRVFLPDEVFADRWGEWQLWAAEGRTGQWTERRWAWAGEMVKRTKQGCRATGLEVDFMVQPQSYRERYFPRAKQVMLASWGTSEEKARGK